MPTGIDEGYGAEQDGPHEVKEVGRKGVVHSRIASNILKDIKPMRLDNGICQGVVSYETENTGRKTYAISLSAQEFQQQCIDQRESYDVSVRQVISARDISMIMETTHVFTCYRHSLNSRKGVQTTAYAKRSSRNTNRGAQHQLGCCCMLVITTH